MQESAEGDTEIVYCRKPLSFVLPAMQDFQAKKNPFKPSFKLSGSEVHILSSRTTIAMAKPTPPIKKFLSLTPTAQQRTRVEWARVPKPSLFAAEPDDISNESFNEDTKVSTSQALPKIADTATKAEEVADESKSETTRGLREGVPKYKFTVTKEIEYHFQQLAKIGFIPMEEVTKRCFLLAEPPARRSNKTLVLDLDDTLVHTIHPKLNYAAIHLDKDNIKTIMYEDPFTKTLTPIKVVLRPHAREFLTTLKLCYELVVRQMVCT